jgi:hypothetical protein
VFFRGLSAQLEIFVAYLLPVIGFALISSRVGLPNYGNLVLLAPLFLVLGFMLGKLFKPREFEYFEAREEKHHGTELQIMVAVFSCFALYHFYVTGITLLKNDIETARFDFSASGLLGIPSRSFLYAIPILALYSAIFFEKKISKITYILWVVFLLTQIFGGFKGGLFTVFESLIFAIILRARMSSSKLLLVISAGLVASIVYVILVGSSYQTLASGTLDLGYIAFRTTEQAAESGHLALAMQEMLSLQIGPAFWHDLSVLFGKYSSGAATMLTVESIVSATLSGVRPEVGNFIVPVTLGGPVYFLLTGGPALLMVGMLLIGLALTILIRRLKTEQSLMARLGAITVIEGLRIFLLNGNGAYLAINLAFTFVLFFVVHMLAARFSGRLEASQAKIVSHTR